MYGLSDVEQLEKSYNNYKDKNGKQAIALNYRIAKIKAFNKMVNDLITKQTDIEPEYQEIIEEKFWELID